MLQSRYNPIRKGENVAKKLLVDARLKLGNNNVAETVILISGLRVGRSRNKVKALPLKDKGRLTFSRSEDPQPSYDIKASFEAPNQDIVEDTLKAIFNTLGVRHMDYEIFEKTS